MASHLQKEDPTRLRRAKGSLMASHFQEECPERGTRVEGLPNAIPPLRPAAPEPEPVSCGRFVALGCLPHSNTNKNVGPPQRSSVVTRWCWLPKKGQATLRLRVPRRPSGPATACRDNESASREESSRDSVQTRPLEETTPRRLLRSESLGRCGMRNDRYQRPIHICGGNAHHQGGADLCGHTEIHEPDLAPLWRFHRDYSRRSSSTKI